MSLLKPFYKIECYNSKFEYKNSNNPLTFIISTFSLRVNSFYPIREIS